MCCFQPLVNRARWCAPTRKAGLAGTNQRFLDASARVRSPPWAVILAVRKQSPNGGPCGGKAQGRNPRCEAAGP